MARNGVTDEQLGHMSRRLLEVLRRVREGTIPYWAAYDGLQNIIEDRIGLRDESLFVSDTHQWQNVCRWNRERDWGFSQEELEAVNPLKTTLASVIIREWDFIGPLYTLVLVPFLDSPEETFRELCAITALQYPMGGSTEWASDLSLAPGIEHQRGLRWCMVDLGAHHTPTCPQRVAAVRSKTSAHVHVMAAAAHFPRWCDRVQRNNAAGVPSAFLAGYRVGKTPQQGAINVPLLTGTNSGRLDLHVQCIRSWQTDLRRMSVPEAVDITDEWEQKTKDAEKYSESVRGLLDDPASYSYS